MMNGAKKSDSLIIPAKPANKAGHPAAEPVEGSSGTERNAELQSTVRTQSREAVSQAQDRIRGAVTRNKKEKLTALLHHITVDVLRRVFFKLKKSAAPGVDGVTWEDYAADLDRNLTDLHARVHRGAYRALPSRRRYIHPPDPEMAEGGCAGRGPLDRDNGGHPAGISGITTACERVSPLCLLSLGPAVAQAPRYGRYDRRAVCRRYNRWLPAPA